ncbi:hypothetical protein N657DRAFT_140917 [Parathielavia appendiculata]|uniref:Myb-like domain-containing protein n=1 Tax=Parathielavia appendiculata TaxID=2587402 RepID=A0AAN6Z0T4_9PEZI|nr:hypothetical protein N657DRAFT_140917 [Parathielavia appendiculata]
MNKNWNDRADKDLFFTILSVKNIGVISGSEWTTIGNHMRSLGYGFTNEGCRQHFQGLRRAQNKAENNVAGDNSRKIDPAVNPITRRPGPGRGRPRKQPAAATAPGSAPVSGTQPAEAQSVGAQSAGVSPADVTSGTSGAPSPLVPGVGQTAGVPHGVAIHPQYPGVGRMPSAPTAPLSTVPGIPGTPGMPLEPAPQGLAVAQGQPQPPPPQASQAIAPQAQMAQAHMTSPEELAVDPNLEEEPEEEHAAKRQRLDDSQEPTLEDEAVLNVLAGHNNPTTPGEYTSEYTYGDA